MDKEEYTIKLDMIATFKDKQVRVEDLLKQLFKENKQLKEELEKYKDNWNKLREWIVYHKHNENIKEHYLVVDYGTLLGKMQELEKGDEIMNNRNFQEIADKIIKVIDEKCDFNEERVSSIITQIEKVKYSSCYKSPELQYISWQELASILSQNFIPQNSRWETEIMIIFNDLSGTVDDYYDLLEKKED